MISSNTLSMCGEGLNMSYKMPMKRAMVWAYTAATVGIPVDFRRISLTGFRSCASRSQTGASQSKQSTE
ncbi:hypothetical protein Tco_1123387 [Tanacetum coccineum]|uniref:Uncharacterized protein n=1 Tax=Tanacetum coccineum TaxID=301880 RepID=A0ABQ5J370_9ASTR